VATEVVNRQRLARINPSRIARIADATLAEVGRRNSTVTVAFVRDRTIRNLNIKYRGNDRATDVLSFPSGNDDGAAGRFVEDNLPADLGDVVVSTDTAQCQAVDAGHSFEREVDELVIHGVLHLCGYDHETDRGQMNRLELRIRRKLLNRNRRA
jgi:probable rRNA maturation factor